MPLARQLLEFLSVPQVLLARGFYPWGLDGSLGDQSHTLFSASGSCITPGVRAFACRREALRLGGRSSRANRGYGRGLGDGRCGSLVGSLDGGPGGDLGGGCVGSQGGGGGRGVSGSLVDIRTGGLSGDRAGGLGSQLARGHDWEGNVLDSQCIILASSAVQQEW
jgi:hypothetical protein